MAHSGRRDQVARVHSTRIVHTPQPSMPFSPRSVLVTGGCGFIGSNFINHALSVWPEAKIVNFDLLQAGSDACNIDDRLRKSPRYRLVLGDLKNSQLVMQTLNEYKVDTVINFAANSHVDDCYKDPIGTTENNVIGMTHLLESCRQYGGLSRFVHISSDEVYGDSGCEVNELPKPEHTLLTPTNTYAASKAGCEAMLNSYRVSYHIPAVSLRMNNIYGPRQWENKVVPRFIKESLEEQPFTIMGDGRQMRSWMYVDDACEGIRRITEKGRIGEIYNLGTHFELSIRELASAIHEEVQRQIGQELPLKTVTIPDRPYNDRRYYIDTSKARTEFEWECRIPFEEGLRRTVDWYLSPRPHTMTLKALLFGGHGWIGTQFARLLEDNKVSCVLATSRPGDSPDSEVEDEMIREAPTHVVCFIGRTHGPGCNTIEYLEGGPEKTMENVRDNMYAPWILAKVTEKLGIHMTYFGTGCIFKYDEEHPVGGKCYTENDVPNYFANSYSVVKGYTDRMMHKFCKNVLNLRIRLPVNFDLDKRNLLVKVAGYKKVFDIPDSITILPDILPIALDLMRKRHTGTLNMTNPGPILHSETLKLYKQLIDPEKQFDIVSDDDADADRMRNSRAHCALDTTSLTQMYPQLRTAKEGIHQAVVEIGKKMGALHVNGYETSKTNIKTTLDHFVPS